METLVEKKHIMKKVIFLLVFIILFNFISPQINWAANTTTTPTAGNVVADASSAAGMGYEAAEWVGGVLWTPIQALFLGLGDTIVTIMQKMVYGLESSFIVLSTSSGIGSTILGWIVGIGTAVGLVALQFIPVVGQVLTVGIITAGVAGVAVGVTVAHMSKPDTFYLPVFGLSPQEIFSNEVPILDVNFFKPNSYTAQDGSGTPVESSAAILQENIAKWYVALRNFAIVGLLSVLVYIGIRILFSSAAGEKAKYKERLMDWLVAMFLLFMMHYIMYFAITLTEAITDALKENLKDVVVNVGDLSQYKQEGDIATIISNNTLTSSNEYGEAGDTLWLTNFMGQSRIQLQMINENSSGDTKLMQFGYTVIYFVFIIYTVVFLFQYLKRVVYMAFLTMIAPVVALTYPIDKMNDGKAQAFDMWLKEYIFNLLLQPFHLLLYTVLIGSAMDFAAENTIYAIVAIGFLIPAEKLLRRFFGFEKAQTASIADAAVGGAMMMKGLDMVKRIGKTKDKPEKENNRGKIRTQKNTNANGVNGMLANSFDRNQNRQLGAGGGREEETAELPGGGEETSPILTAGGASDSPILESGGQRSASTLITSPGGSLTSGSAGGGNSGGSGLILPGGSSTGGSAGSGTGSSLGDQIERQEGFQIDPNSGLHLSATAREQQAQARREVQARANASSSGTIKNDGTAPSVRRGIKNLAATYMPTKRDVALGAAKGARFVASSGVKLAGRAAGITAGLTAAAIATTASGGKNATSSISAGLIAGNAVGGNLAGTALGAMRSDSRRTDEIHNVFEEGRLGSEAYQDKIQEQADDYTVASREVKQQYIQEFGSEGYKEKLEASKAYRKEGITDDKMIIEAMSLGAEFGEDDSQKRILVAKLASTYKSEKDVQALKKRLVEAKGLSEEDAEMVANGVRKINKLV